MFDKIFEFGNSGFFYFHFFILKFPSYKKLAMTSQFDLIRFYDVIINFNLVLTLFVIFHEWNNWYLLKQKLLWYLLITSWTTAIY